MRGRISRKIQAGVGVNTPAMRRGADIFDMLDMLAAREDLAYADTARAQSVDVAIVYVPEVSTHAPVSTSAQWATGIHVRGSLAPWAAGRRARAPGRA